MTNFKLIAFEASIIKGGETLAAGRALAAQIKKGSPLDVKAFVAKARAEAGWPVAVKILMKAIENVDNGRLKAMVAEWVIPGIEVPEMINDPFLPFRVARSVVPGNLLEGRKIAAELNEQNPGRRLRLPTEDELERLNSRFKLQLDGIGKWIWTETEQRGYPGQFILRQQDENGRNFYQSKFSEPDFACDDDGIRFVEDR